MLASPFECSSHGGACERMCCVYNRSMTDNSERKGLLQIITPHIRIDRRRAKSRTHLVCREKRQSRAVAPDYTLPRFLKDRHIHFLWKVGCLRTLHAINVAHDLQWHFLPAEVISCRNNRNIAAFTLERNILSNCFCESHDIRIVLSVSRKTGEDSCCSR